LENGQAFGWNQDTEAGGVWHGVVRDRVVTLREVDNDVLYRVIPHLGEAEATEEFHKYLCQYFSLHDPDLSLDKLSREWISREPERLGLIVGHLKGMRLLRQDPLECTISFICSSNNNIKRIKLMLGYLRRYYGKRLDSPGGEVAGDLGFAEGEWYEFPSLEALCRVEEKHLRELGFGYRAKYVVGAAKLIAEKGGTQWLLGLRKLSPGEVREQLIQLPGVGPKVADCIALFSLDQLGCVPVDTHVWQLVQREYKHLVGSSKTVTKKVYENITAFFQETFGRHCGWAHSFLFTAELPHFLHRLPEHLRNRILSERKLKKKKPKRKSNKKNSQPKQEKGTKPAEQEAEQAGKSGVSIANNSDVKTPTKPVKNPANRRLNGGSKRFRSETKTGTGKKRKRTGAKRKGCEIAARQLALAQA